MAEEVFVDVQYQGLELGRRLRMEDFAVTQAYLHHPTPMPVGSALVVDAGDGLAIPVQVARVNEQVAGSEKPAGMYVTPLALPQSVQGWWDARVAETGQPVMIVPVLADELASIEPAPDTTQTMAAVDLPEDSGDTQVMEAVAPDEVKVAQDAVAADDSAAKGKKKRKRRKRSTKG